MIRKLLLPIGLLLLVAACSMPPAPASGGGGGSGGTTPIPGAALMNSYWANIILTQGTFKETLAMVYRPRQFQAGAPGPGFQFVDLVSAGPFKGWSYLSVPNEGTWKTYPNDHQLIHIELNRDATVGVLWLGDATSIPTWLQGWTDGGVVQTHDNLGNTKSFHVFTKVMTAGAHDLGSLQGLGFQPYQVLLGKADGTPPADPPVPSGHTLPQANQTCPQWVIDQYQVTLPDGSTHETWHPQIDPVYWCYFRHEHGSDPRQFVAYTQIKNDLAFNRYSAETGRNEPLFGFKLFLFQDPHSGDEILLIAHMTSSDPNRACVRFHTLDLYAAKANGQLIAALHFKGDTGAPLAVFPNNVRVPFVPTSCPNVQNVPSGDSGDRAIPVAESGTGYETWQYDFSTAAQLPIVGSVVLAMDNPQIRVVPDNGPGVSPSGTQWTHWPGTANSDQDGTFRWAVVSNSPLGAVWGIDTTKVPTGTFCTDYTGATRMSCSATGAVAQHIYAQARVVLTPFAAGDGGKWRVDNPWTDVYINKGDFLPRINRNLEHQVPIPGNN